MLANKYIDRFQSVNYGGLPNTLVCALPRDPGDHLTELRVSPQNIWLAYGTRASWVTVRQETTREVDWIARAIGVTQFSRLGLRLSLLWGGEDREQVLNMLVSRVLHVDEHGWSSVGQVTGADFILNLTAERLSARVQMNPVMNLRREERVTLPGQEPLLPAPDLEFLPDFALNLDVDLADTHPTDSIDVKPHLNRSIGYLENVLIPFVNHLLEESS